MSSTTTARDDAPEDDAALAESATRDDATDHQDEATAVAEADPAEQLIQQGNNGANWTLIVDAVAHELGSQQPDIANILMGVAIGFSIFVSLIAAAFGWLSRQRILIIYGLGMFVYLLDGLLFLFMEDWMSLAFHAYALFSMWSGFTAYRQVRQLEMPVEPELAVA
jgi:hypothetical protein